MYWGCQRKDKLVSDLRANKIIECRIEGITQRFIFHRQMGTI